MDFLIINSVQNLRGGDFLYLCIVRTARWTFGHWDEDATHILRGTARPPVGRCFSSMLPRAEPDARNSRKATSCRCLDAAHGKTVNPIVARKRPHFPDLTPKTASVDNRADKRGRSPTPAGHTDARQTARLTCAEARSRRCVAIAEWNAAEGANNGFTANVNAVTSYGMSGAACGARLRASAAGGCGPHGSKSRTTATANRSPGPAAIVPPRQPYFVILNEVKNLFPCEPKAACGLFRARRRKTNEVQSRIYFGQGYRFFVAMLLRMTNY